MKRLEVIYAKQGDLLILDMRLAVKAALKKLFPHSNPLQVILGFAKKDELKVPKKSQFVRHLLPILTGLEKEDLKKNDEILILQSYPEKEIFTIKSTLVF